MRRIKKTKWSKPKLIVLTRGKSGEKVLYMCKISSFPGSSASVFQACIDTTSCPGTCAAPCIEFTPS